MQSLARRQLITLLCCSGLAVIDAQGVCCPKDSMFHHSRDEIWLSQRAIFLYASLVIYSGIIRLQDVPSILVEFSNLFLVFW
jgi:hypothetical protein